MLYSIIIAAIIFAGCYLIFSIYLDFSGKIYSWKQLRRQAVGNLEKFLEGQQLELEAISDKTSPCQSEDVSVHELINLEEEDKDQAGHQRFKYTVSKTFYFNWIVPYMKPLENTDSLESVLNLLSLLDSKGDCPSVAGQFEDPESQNLTYSGDKRCYDHLKKVTLLEHSINVANELILDKKENGQDFVIQLGSLMVLGLGHDLGKIPHIAQTVGADNRYDHCIISQRLLADILPEEYPQKAEILEAVKNHHHFNDGNNGYAKSLKKADQAARSKELTKQLKTEKQGDQKGRKTLNVGEPAPDLSWLNSEEVLDEIAKIINRVDRQGHYSAFSYKKVVYLQPSVIFNIVGNMASKAGKNEINAKGISKDGQNEVILAFKKLIENHVLSKIAKGCIGQKYRITASNHNRLNPGMYLPLKITAFNIPSKDLEDRKNKIPDGHVLRNISEVKVDRG